MKDLVSFQNDLGPLLVISFTAAPKHCCQCPLLLEPKNGHVVR